MGDEKKTKRFAYRDAASGLPTMPPPPGYVPPAPPPLPPRPDAASVDLRARNEANQAKLRASQVESALNDLTGAVIRQFEVIEAQNSELRGAIIVLARELGADKKLDPTLLASTPPPPPDGKRRPRTIRDIAKRGRTYAAIAVALEVARHIPDIANALVKVFGGHA